MKELAQSRQATLPPNLAKLRGTSDGSPRRGAPAPAATTETALPPPGGLGAGVTYLNGSLQVHDSASLLTHMIVYPDGIPALPDWLFTTATNRTEKGVEVVGVFRNPGSEDIGIFDWSCSSTHPCDGGAESPSWIWSQAVSAMPCYHAKQPDAVGITHETLYYANTTVLSAGLWHNNVHFWNTCSNTWDLVYTHAYDGTQVDCSASGSCGWWGPIIENFFALDGIVPIPELGFSDTRLAHDGVVSKLPSSETGWSSPPANWNVCNRTPNTSWGATNLPCMRSPSPLNISLQVSSDWETGYCANVSVTNTGSTTTSTWGVWLSLHDSAMTSSWSAEFGPTSPGNYLVGPLSWNANLAPGGNTSFGFCATKTGTNWRPTIPGPVPDGTYKLVARHSGKSMDAYQARTDNGTQIIQWPYRGGSNQQWKVTEIGGGKYSIIGVQSGKSLDIYANRSTDGTKVELWNYNGGLNQQFTFTPTGGGYFRITPQNAPGSCLDVANASTGDGALVQLWAWWGGENQQWALQSP